MKLKRRLFSITMCVALMITSLLSVAFQKFDVYAIASISKTYCEEEKSVSKESESEIPGENSGVTSVQEKVDYTPSFNLLAFFGGFFTAAIGSSIGFLLGATVGHPVLGAVICASPGLFKLFKVIKDYSYEICEMNFIAKA